MAAAFCLSNDEIKQKVLNSYGHFVSDLDGDSIADWLIGDRVITRERWEKIRQEEPVERNRNRALVNWLLDTANPSAFLSLRNALQKEDHWLLDMIDQETVPQNPDCTNRALVAEIERLEKQITELKKRLELELFWRESKEELESKLKTSRRTLLIMTQSLRKSRLDVGVETALAPRETELHGSDQSKNDKSDYPGTNKLCSLVISPDFKGYGFGVRSIVRGQSCLHSHVIDFVDTDSPAKRSGLQVNDLIAEVNGQSLLRAPHRELVRQMTATPGILNLLVVDEEREKFIQKTRFGSTLDEPDRSSSSSSSSSSPADSGYLENPQLLHKLRPLTSSDRDSFRGLTVIGNNLYTISRYSYKVRVYEMQDYCFVCRFKLKGLLVNPWDIASCGRYERLYIMNYNSERSHQILSVDSNSGSLIKGWSPRGVNANGISVTKEFTVLLTISEQHLLNEYKPDGELIREIRLLPNLLDSGIVYPLHAIKLNRSLYAVSHEQRICLVNTDGRLLNSFNSNPGLGKIGLKCPLRLTADESGSILVVDYGNGRVLLLNFDLDLSRVLLDKQDGLRLPYRVCLNESKRQLLVIDGECSYVNEHNVHSTLSIFQIK